MIAIFTDIIKVVVFSTSANTLLGIGGTCQTRKLRVRVYSPEENRLVLAHASIYEQQTGIIEWDYRGGRNQKRYQLLQVAESERDTYQNYDPCF